MLEEKKLVSFVLPVYNEREVIGSFYTELGRVLSSLDNRYNCELIFVNDGSTDDTLEILKSFAEKDGRVIVIEFSRNFGHQVALSAGLDQAKGEAVIVMDTDLQDPPSAAIDLIKEWEAGHEVVYAKRRSRVDPLFKKIAIYIFYRFLSTISDISIPVDSSDFRLLDRSALEALRSYPEKNRYLRGLSTHIGFRQKEVLYDRSGRLAGETHYPFKKLLRLSMDGIMGFSSMPLKIISRVGFLVSFLSVVGILFTLYYKFFSSAVIPGWSFIVLAIFFIGGVQLLMLGIIAGYIGRIYTEAQDRPLYIVRKIHRKI